MISSLFLQRLTLLEPPVFPPFPRIFLLLPLSFHMRNRSPFPLVGILFVFLTLHRPCHCHPFTISPPDPTILAWLTFPPSAPDSAPFAVSAGASSLPLFLFYPSSGFFVFREILRSTFLPFFGQLALLFFLVNPGFSRLLYPLFRLTS